MAANRSTQTDVGLNYQSGGLAGSRPAFKAVGLRTQTAAGKNVTTAVGRSFRMNRGPGLVTIMDDGAKSAPDADGPGFRAKFGLPPGSPGARAEKDRRAVAVSGGRRFHRRPVASLELESARGSTPPATSDRSVIPSLTFAILDPI